MGVFLSDISDRWVKDFGYIRVYGNAIANLTSIYCNGTCMREVDGVVLSAVAGRTSLLQVNMCTLQIGF
jgi:hypothetical protein